MGTPIEALVRTCYLILIPLQLGVGFSNLHLHYSLKHVSERPKCIANLQVFQTLYYQKCIKTPC